MLLNDHTSKAGNHSALLEDISLCFSTPQGQSELLETWKECIDTASTTQICFLWGCSIDAGNEEWQDLLWSSKKHQEDPVLYSIETIMSDELDRAMTKNKNKKVVAYNAFVRKLKQTHPGLVGQFEQELTSTALRRSMSRGHIEDRGLLEMFSSRPGFAWMKFEAEEGKRDLAQELASILEPIIERVEMGGDEDKNTLEHFTAPSVLATMKHCYKSGMVSSGTSGLALGQVIGKAVMASEKLFRPVLDCWVSHGGPWQTLMIIQPDLARIIEEHPTVREKMSGGLSDVGSKPPGIG